MADENVKPDQLQDYPYVARVLYGTDWFALVVPDHLRFSPDGFNYADQSIIDQVHSWSVFTLQWHAVLSASLFGRE